MLQFRCMLRSCRSRKYGACFILLQEQNFDKLLAQSSTSCRSSPEVAFIGAGINEDGLASALLGVGGLNASAKLPLLHETVRRESGDTPLEFIVMLPFRSILPMLGNLWKVFVALDLVWLSVVAFSVIASIVCSLFEDGAGIKNLAFAATACFTGLTVGDWNEFAWPPTPPLLKVSTYLLRRVHSIKKRENEMKNINVCYSLRFWSSTIKPNLNFTNGQVIWDILYLICLWILRSIHGDSNNSFLSYPYFPP